MRRHTEIKIKSAITTKNRTAPGRFWVGASFAVGLIGV
jgi:hypothetical protein